MIFSGINTCMHWMVKDSKPKQASTHQMLFIRNQKNHNVDVVSCALLVVHGYYEIMSQ